MLDLSKLESRMMVLDAALLVVSSRGQNCKRIKKLLGTKTHAGRATPAREGGDARLEGSTAAWFAVDTPATQGGRSTEDELRAQGSRGGAQECDEKKASKLARMMTS